MNRYIEADATLRTIKKYLCETAMNNFITNRKFADACEEIAEHRIATWIDAIPTADVREVVHGEWIPCGGSFRCSKCASMPEFKDIRRLHFCPNCGADMRKGSEE